MHVKYSNSNIARSTIEITNFKIIDYWFRIILIKVQVDIIIAMMEKIEIDNNIDNNCYCEVMKSFSVSDSMTAR